MWLSEFEIVLRDRVIPNGAIKIENGRIAEIRDKPVEHADIEGGGRLLLPGFIDMHGDMVEREVEPRIGVHVPMPIGIAELDKKLASCGVTTAYAALSFIGASVTSGVLRSEDHTTAIIDTIAGMKDDLLVDHRIHARFEVTFTPAIPKLQKLMDDGRLHLISLMDHTPGQGQYRDVELYIARIAKERGMSVADASEVVGKRMAGRNGQGDVLNALQDLSARAQAAGIVLSSHDDDTLEKVELVHGLGAALSEFPVTLEAAQEARRLGMHTAMGAPNALRGESYSGNLSARQAYEAGLLDMLASDYHPASILPAVLGLAELRGDGLAAAAALTSANPAHALGLTDRGAIEPGLLADLVAADRHPVPRVRATFRAGRMIYGDGTLSLSGKVERLAPALAERLPTASRESA
ncbi:alpha-D-ribose 1-methylphosphonate 5-triphosphate diphosphatase [Mesorhizobium sp. NZP2077]|uniref:alpha-D-ribose 1-methylphosphonate 5-triphosphate diphosphatase n=1 Tax=Mesorhizobium sp. NZP2077 TaxID=2483404 RepID=UPI001557ADB6|nr:alpha-D-ribose 1-methylphosphonate 5-triphosphate diphosphatase [Mesorhizobium sp. NZP2077]QKC82540.1 alpha-D-ribose 1-methylphosphonate 5-triphosphate diphosphatase [Mesorhizobium sp. NZP2077]QKD16033.1 alpha-D-ribose 1-methylphosphonate 5-triphosphate diphosphatase [Mesorhizobium sp. NZP2077]